MPLYGSDLLKDARAPLAGSRMSRGGGMRGGDIGKLLEDVEPEEGFLQQLGKVVDWPGRLVRSTIVGQPLEAFGGEYITGWDMLKKMGIRDKEGQFDGVDVAAFLTEVLLDPLTYAGGLGGLTKAGKTASSLGKVKGVAAAGMAGVKAALPAGMSMAEFLKHYRKVQKGLASAMPGHERLYKTMDRVRAASGRQKLNYQKLREMGAETELAATWGAQAALDVPQRKFLSLKIPFSETEKVLIAGAPLVGAIGATGKALKNAPVLSQMLRLMSPAASKTAELQPWMYETKIQMRTLLEEEIKSQTKLGQRAQELLAIERKTNPDLKMEDFLERFMNARESFGVTPQLQKEINDIHMGLAVKVENKRSSARGKLAKHFTNLMGGENRRLRANARVNRGKASILKKYRSAAEGKYGEKANNVYKLLKAKLGTVSAKLTRPLKKFGKKINRYEDRLNDLRVERGVLAADEYDIVAKYGLVEEDMAAAFLTPDGWQITGRGVMKGTPKYRAITKVKNLRRKVDAVKASIGKAEERLTISYSGLGDMLSADDVARAGGAGARAADTGAMSTIGKMVSKTEQEEILNLFKREGAKAKRLSRAAEFDEVALMLEGRVRSKELIDELALEQAETAIPRMIDLPDAETLGGSWKPVTAAGEVSDEGVRSQLEYAARELGGEVAASSMPYTASAKTVRRFTEPLDNATRSLLEKGQKKIKTLQDNIKNSEELMEKLSPDSQVLVRSIDRELGELLARRVDMGATKARNVIDARLQSLTKRYAERQLTQEARDFLKKHKSMSGKGSLYDDFRKHFSQWTAKTGGDVRRIDAFREKLTTEVNEWFKDRTKTWNRKGYKTVSEWFNKDFAITFPGKVAGDERSLIMSSMVQDFIGYANKNGLLKELSGDPGEGLVPLGDFLWENGVHRYKARGSKVAIDVGSGANRSKSLMTHGLPVEVVEEIRGIVGKMTEPSDLSSLGNIFDRVTGVQRWALTIPWPGYHSRNFMTNVMLNWMGGVSRPKYYRQGMRAFLDPKERKNLEALGVFTGGWSEQIAKEVFGSKGTFGKLGAALRKKFPKGSKGMDEYRRVVEDVGRAAHYYGKKADGLTDFEAVESVNKYLLDYSELTPFEKRYGRRMFLFYQWTRKMSPLLVREYFQNPSRMSLLTRGSTLPTYKRPKNLPEFVRSSFAIPLPWKDQMGRDQFITTFGTPLEEFRRFDYTQATGGTMTSKLGEIFKRMATQMTPPLKQFIETTAGEDFFFRKPISELDRVKEMFGLEKLLPGFRADVMKSGDIRRRANPDFLYGLRQTPVSRLLSTAQQLGDKEKGALEKIGKVISGVSTARVFKEDEARQVANWLRKELERRGGEGMVRGRKIVYPTAAGKLDPETTALWKKYQVALKRQRETQTIRKSRGR